MRIFTAILAIVSVTILTSAAAPGNNKYALATNYTVGIHGTSNLHDWDETVGTVTGTGTINWNSDGSFDLDAMTIKMDVHSIKSTEGSMMNNNTYKALKADNNPEITLVLVSPIKSFTIAAGHTIAARINLTIAGVTKAVSMPVVVDGQKNGSVSFQGSVTIKMTDFGISPPVALLGTLKTGDNITIHFKTTFATSS